MARRGPLSLSAQIEAFARRFEQRRLAFMRAYAYAITAEIVSRSPVGDPATWQNPPAPGYVGGQFKGNWQVSITGRPAGTLERIDPDGGETLAAANAALSRLSGSSRIHIVNNLPYARRLEYGWSDQAPAGIVRLTIASADSLARQALAQARREVP